MSRILLAIGLASNKAAAEPELVYLGRSGDAMRAALARATQPRLIIVPHLQGIPKNNPRAATNEAAAAEQAAAEEKIEIDLATARAQLATELAETKQLLALAEDAYTAANKRIAELESPDRAVIVTADYELTAARAVELLEDERARAGRASQEAFLAKQAYDAAERELALAHDEIAKLKAQLTSPAAAPVPASPDPAPAPETPAASSSAESGEERPPRRRR